MDLKARNVTFEADPYWPERFTSESARLADLVGEHLLDTIHVGSTALRNLPGKPALDIIAVVAEESSVETVAAHLDATDGYERHGDTTVVIRWEDEYAVFVKLHTPGDEKARNQVLFREYLRDNPDARRDYRRVKEQAIEAHPDDLEAYTNAKTEVVSSILERALEADYDERLPAYL